MSTPPSSAPLAPSEPEGVSAVVASIAPTRLIALNCPSCGAPLDPPPDAVRFPCPFCARPILIDNSLVPAALSPPELAEMDQMLYQAQELGMAYYLEIVNLQVRIIVYRRRLQGLGPRPSNGAPTAFEMDQLMETVRNALDATWVKRYQMNAGLARASHGSTPMQLPPFPSISPEEVSVEDCYHALESLVGFLRGLLSMRRSVALHLARDPAAIDAGLQRCREAAVVVHGLSQSRDGELRVPAFPLLQVPLLDLSDPREIHAIQLTPPPG